jgi:cellulose synthase/poly-beta-1,6-N-acetylglucosamine synthase-like glycosyltransferase
LFRFVFFLIQFMSSSLILLLSLLFWLSLAYLLYVEVGYLLLLWLISRFRPAPLPPPTQIPPSLTVLVAAHNEEQVIAARLDNLLAQDYPPELLEIIVASDHSTDRTDSIVQSYSDRRVRLSRSTVHGGKIAALRQAEPLIQGDIVVFTDADAFFQPAALQHLANHFADPKVGAVSGREQRPTGAGAAKGEGLYNRLETLVKRLESHVGDQVLLHGGIFAMRRQLLPFVPDHLTHDAIVPLQLVLGGFRVLYEPQAVSIESYPLDTRQDWQRRIRTVMQAYQSYLYVKTALNPLRAGFFALQVISHRFMRWFVLPVLLLAWLSNLLLFPLSPIYQVIFIAQLLCYALAGVGFVLDRLGQRPPAVFYFPFYFLYIHLAAFSALLKTWQGRTVATWRPAQRLHEGGNHAK